MWFQTVSPSVERVLFGRTIRMWGWWFSPGFTVNTGLRPNSAGIPYTLLLRIEAIGFPTFGLLLYKA